MEPIPQIDITNPQHVCVITRDRRVIVSIYKDGITTTLGFPLASPAPPAQQPAPQITHLDQYQDKR
jgi:hypothetical protein